MKKLRLVLSVFAFAFAIAGAAMTASGSANLHAVYGQVAGQCVPTDDEPMQEGCGTSGMVTCTVWIEDEGEVDAYHVQQSTFICTVPYKRSN